MWRIKFLSIMLVMASFLSMTWSGNASTINAASCSQANVQAAISSAIAGDTVVVPAGSCTWTSTLSLGTKKLSIIGAGIDSTVITASGLPAYTAVINLGTGGSRLSNITLANGYIQVAGQGFVVSNNKIQNLSSVGSGVIVSFGDGEHPTGVIHSNQLINTRVVVEGNGSYADGQSYRWSQPQTHGGITNIAYIEDNTFTRTLPTGTLNAIDANYGARYVFRYNTLHTTTTASGTNLAFYIEAHSVQGDNRAVQRWEIYGNLLNNEGGYHYYPFSIRSGTGVAFNNSVIGNWTNDGVGIDNRRSTETFPISGKCAGTSGWDGNTGTAGYPCRDQIGRGHDTTLWHGGAYTQVLMPAYAWNNRNDASATAPMQLKTTDSHIQANRDYYNYTATFNGTSGVGCGTVAARPTTCTTGVAYWATNQSCSSTAGMVGANPGNPASGTLYKCTATNTWTAYFTPGSYPHPLRKLMWATTYIVEAHDHATGWALETGKTYTYAITVKTAFIGKEVAKALQESTLYSSVASKDLVESKAGSYYYDTTAGKLYVRSTNNVNPNNYLITVYFQN